MRWRMAVITMVCWIWAGAGELAAQQALSVGADLIFYGDNTEFRNPFREGETIFGTAGRLDARIDLGGSAGLTLGVFGNARFGGGSAFELVRPVLALTVAGRRSRFVFGTLESPRAGHAPGPDRTGPHGLLPPLQRETLAFDRPYEAGLQWLHQGRRLEHDAWLHWQRLNTGAHRERLDAGLRAAVHVSGPFAVPVQAHIVHEGGQLFATGPVRDSVAAGTGLVLSNVRRPTAAAVPARPAERERHALDGPAEGAPQERLAASLELIGLWSRYTPDRAIPERTRDGGAFFGRAALAKGGWRVHLVMWRGDDFITDEGDPNYMSIRRDGSRYRGVRDYAEAGVTRTFALAPGALVEVAFRLHRTEHYYEYSYRVLAVARARARVR